VKATITLTVELDEAWLEHEGRRRGRDDQVEDLVSLLEGRAFDSVRHCDGVEQLAVCSSLHVSALQA
jgi:hypothetical protein